MGSSKIQTVQETPVALTGLFGSRTPLIESRSNDSMLLILSLDAGASVTAIELKPVVDDGEGGFADVHRQGDSGMIADVMSIPVTPSTNSQKVAVRVDTRSLNGFYLDGRVIGGAAGAIRGIMAVRDGSLARSPSY